MINFPAVQMLQFLDLKKKKTHKDSYILRQFYSD